MINRSTDLVARYGGEEFAVILPDTAADAAEWLARTCLSAVADLAMPHAHSCAAPHVSISIGLYTMPGLSDIAAETLVVRADQALYQAKRAGRNCYRRYLAEPAPELKC